jgi:pterin-4a-carbinolamine dehydratase
MKEIMFCGLFRQKNLFIEKLFYDFVEAFSFMTAAVNYTEKSDHHPNWKMCIITKVTIDLNTHDADGITKGFQLAKGIDQIVKNTQTFYLKCPLIYLYGASH